MSKLDILFVHPNASKKIYQELSKKHSAIEPPIWAAMLANHCRVNNFGVQILDCEAEMLSWEESAKTINDINPKVVCFVVYGQQPSASSQNMSGAVGTADLLKKLNPNVKTLFVGGHVSALPLEVLKEESVDMVCQNEGVYTISNLLKTDLSIQQIDLVKGLGYKVDGIGFLNTPEKIVPRSRLEHDLPGMAWDLLPDIKKYRTAGWHSWSNNTESAPFASLYTSLGCPYKCSFCMINIINRTDSSDGIASADSNVFRYWNPEFIIKQFDQIAEMGVDILKKAGVNWLGLGIENPNQVLRKEIHKDGYKEVRIGDLIKDMKAAGINIGGNYIFGLPMDTHETMKDTLNFAMENKTEMVNFYCAMAYPGSPLYLQARKNGWELPSKYEGYSQHSYETLNLSNDNLTAREILEFRDKAFIEYNSHPDYLNLLETKFGKKAKDNMEDTLKIKLKRKLLGIR